MFTSYNPGHIGVSLPLTESMDLGASVGFSGYDFGLQPIHDAITSQGVEYAKDLFASRNLQVGATNLPFMPYLVTDDEYKEHLTKLPALLESASAIGATCACMWILPGSNTLERDANYDHHVARFQPIAKMLEDNGMRLALEYIGPKTSENNFKYPFFRDIPGVRKLASLIGHNSGLLLDSWHWYTSTHSIKELQLIQKGELAHIHINDAPSGIAPEDQIDNQRMNPCTTGVINIKGFMDHLRAIEYDFTVTSEPFHAETNALDDKTSTQLNYDTVMQAMDL